MSLDNPSQSEGPVNLLRPPDPLNAWDDGQVHCVGYEVADELGCPLTTVCQGQRVTLTVDYQIIGDLGLTAAWLELRDDGGILVYGNNPFQDGSSVVCQPSPGSIIRITHTISLDVCPGTYTLSLGLSSTTPEAYLEYRDTPGDPSVWPDINRPRHDQTVTYRPNSRTEEQFSGIVQEHSRVVCDQPVTVGFDETGRLRHYGLVNLHSVSRPSQTHHSPAIRGSSESRDRPTVIHVTHWKAGSQWIYRILSLCAPDRVVPPRTGSGHFAYTPPTPGLIYPTVYLTKEQFDAVPLPESSRAFVVIRDLRDTLVSLYYSVSTSHEVSDRNIHESRHIIKGMSFEGGMTYLMDTWLSACARIQLSWLESGYRLIRYEALLKDDLEILENLLLEECELGISRDDLHRAVLGARFEAMSGGRRRGDEDQSSHYRKGVAGDWRAHFTNPMKEAFKARYGGLLVTTGYEHDLAW